MSAQRWLRVECAGRVSTIPVEADDALEVSLDGVPLVGIVIDEAMGEVAIGHWPNGGEWERLTTRDLSIRDPDGAPKKAPKNCGEVLYRHGLIIGFCAEPYGVEHDHDEPNLDPVADDAEYTLDAWIVNGEIAQLRLMDEAEAV